MKRELLDGLGSVLKWLIGTPDAKDAQHYERCIELLENREIEQADILKQQIQIVSSTISNFNETIFKISYEEYAINENLERIMNYLNTTNKIIFDLKTSEEVSSISMQILESVLSLEMELDDILTSILFVKSGAVHPSIISIERLYVTLLSSAHMRNDKNLVLPVTLENIHKILDSATVTSYIYMNKLTYILDFPLVKNNKFTLYHLYSIPIIHPNSTLYSTILPEQTYLAASPTRQQYVSTSSIDDCKPYAPSSWVCNLPVYNYNTRPICEMAILLHTYKQLPSTCEPATFSAHINMFQPVSTNKWVYILQNETACVLQCEGNTKHINLQGAGVLTLNKGCKFFSSFVTLAAADENFINITHPILTVDIEQICENPDDLPKSPELIPIRINNVPMDTLKSIKEELKLQSKIIESHRQRTFIDKNSNKLSMFSYTIGIAMFAYLLYKICRHCLRKITRSRDHHHENGCINIFNNCFDKRRQRTTHVAIPMTSITPGTSSSAAISDDSDSDAATSSHSQRLGSLKTSQSLF